MGILSSLEKEPWLALENAALLWERQTNALEKVSRLLCFGKGSVAVHLSFCCNAPKTGAMHNFGEQ
jgi:hypothetical protein